MALAVLAAALRYLREAPGLFAGQPRPGMRFQLSRGGEVWECARDCGGAAGYLQPGVDVLQVDAHGSFRQAELAGDLGVGVPGGDQAQQFPLAGGGS